MQYKGIISRYGDFLPVNENTPVCSLNEGNTPLIRAEKIAREAGAGVDVYLKYEGLNPTGSFKDRGMTLAVSKALEKKAESVICASTGNTSASAAAYAARAGLPCFVIVPEGNIALGKLAQALVCGAKVITLRGNFDAALGVVREIVSERDVELVNSINPFRVEGQKTAAFEICDALGGAPEYNIIPVGNAGNITAYWKGYREYMDRKISGSLPRMLGFQAEGAAPLVKGSVVENPDTIATAIRIGNPASWEGAAGAVSESGGGIDCVTDDEILRAYRLLAESEGVFCEPASAASVAGFLKLARSGFFKNAGGRAVCVLTGHGLKDPDTAIKSISAPDSVPADKKSVLKAMGF